jgi:hypothetical protein
MHVIYMMQQNDWKQHIMAFFVVQNVCMVINLYNYANFIKRLSDPATCHGGAWGERRYSSYSFLTSALDGGEWSASCPGRALPPGK